MGWTVALTKVVSINCDLMSLLLMKEVVKNYSIDLARLEVEIDFCKSSRYSIETFKGITW